MAGFSRDNILAANDLVLQLLDSLPLAEIHRNEPGVLQTSSGAQQHEVAVDSLYTNYSYKYFGKEQGATAYNFIDKPSLIETHDREKCHYAFRNAWGEQLRTVFDT